MRRLLLMVICAISLALTPAFTPQHAKAARAGDPGGGELFHDDFSRFPAGRLSSPVGELNGAI